MVGNIFDKYYFSYLGIWKIENVRKCLKALDPIFGGDLSIHVSYEFAKMRIGKWWLHKISKSLHMNFISIKNMKWEFGNSYKTFLFSSKGTFIFFYFQVRETPAPLNILTPTPAPDHLWGCSVRDLTNLHVKLQRCCDTMWNVLLNMEFPC